jgi:hypothetical protein
MGFRIPAVVVSPYARRSRIDHTIYGFESILKMIRYRYGLPPRTPRDLYSNNIASAFDFASKPRYDPPALPHPAEVISSPCSGLPISAGRHRRWLGALLSPRLGSIATGHPYRATARGSGTPTDYGAQTVWAFLEEQADGRRYANNTSDAPAADVTRACTTAAQTRTALASAQRRLRHAHTKAAKGRWKAVVGRPRGTAAAARRQARAACGTVLGL